MSKIYTGIGSRETPQDILTKMWKWSSALAVEGYTLRSGAAPGADTSFERGCDKEKGKKEIYLPWGHFNDNPSPLYHVCPEAMELADEIYGSSFKYLKRPVKLLMARNMYQVTGLNLDTPSDFVICWTPDGCTRASERTRKTGGTGQAIAYASSLKIPVFNLQRDDAEEQLIEFLAEKE